MIYLYLLWFINQLSYLGRAPPCWNSSEEATGSDSDWRKYPTQKSIVAMKNFPVIDMQHDFPWFSMIFPLTPFNTFISDRNFPASHVWLRNSRPTLGFEPILLENQCVQQRTKTFQTTLRMKYDDTWCISTMWNQTNPKLVVPSF